MSLLFAIDLENNISLSGTMAIDNITVTSKQATSKNSKMTDLTYGVEARISTFYTEYIGLWSNISFYFNGQRFIRNKVESSTGSVMNIKLGPLFRYNFLDDKLNVFAGVGINYSIYFSTGDMNFGIGSTFGAQYLLNKSIGILAGTNLSYDFYNKSCAEEDFQFNSINIEPFIGASYRF